jgi:HD-GYP domain-containing protein (c-di-GMP phosphodiesterase class II)
LTDYRDEMEQRQLARPLRPAESRAPLDNVIVRQVEEIITMLNFCLSGTLLYPIGHPAVILAITRTIEVMVPFLNVHSTLVLDFEHQEIIYKKEVLLESSNLGAQFYQYFTSRGIYQLTFNRGLTENELTSLVYAFRQPEREGKLQYNELVEILLQRNVIHIRLGGERKALTTENGSRYMIAKSLYERGARQLESAALNSVKLDHFDVGMIKPLVSELIVSLMEDSSVLMSISSIKSYDNYLFNHCMNVCILSLCFAIYLKFDPKILLEIGVGTLLHDIGKVKIPLEILHKPEKLTEKEWEIVRNHPVEGAKLIINSRYITELPFLIIYTHHWRYADTDGYPATRLDIRQNPIVAMVSVCDCYDAMTTDRPYNKSYLPSTAIDSIKKMAGTVYDPQIVSFFSHMMGIYPIGTLVKLNTGEIAIVLRHNPDNSFRPHLKIIQDAAGNRIDDIVIYDLTEKDEQEKEYLHSIESIIDPASLSFNPWDSL